MNESEYRFNYKAHLFMLVWIVGQDDGRRRTLLQRLLTACTEQVLASRCRAISRLDLRQFAVRRRAHTHR